MKFSSIVAIYFLFWCASAFLLLPFGVRTSEELGENMVPGQAESAPHRFDLKRHLLKAAILGAVLFAIYYVNWAFGWINAENVGFF
jgi:predicted secreted protein